jgi:hypothetical protein
LALANMKLQREIGRALEQRLREWIELDDRALKRARLQDTLRQGGSTFELAALAAEKTQHDKERDALDGQIAQLHGAQKLALAQLRVLYGFADRPTSNLFEGIEIRRP